MPRRNRLPLFATLVALTLGIGVEFADAADAPRISSPPAAPGDRSLTRARELLYFLREYTVFERTDSWIKAVHELSQLGPTAVPEIIAELDRTNHDLTRRVLPMTLRAIGDKRAIPALLRALPKCKLQTSSCGVWVSDPLLAAFMRKNSPQAQIVPNNRPNAGPPQGNAAPMPAREQFDTVDVDRSVGEIVSALEKITEHSEGHEMFPSSDPKMLRVLSDRWTAWWKTHAREFLTEADLAVASPAASLDDPVATAGLARYGPTFPTGGGVTIGPELVLDLGTGGKGLAWAGSQSVDFDTGTVKETVIRDLRRNDPVGTMVGVDAYGAVYNYVGPGMTRELEGKDLHIWRVPDTLWDQIDEVVATGKKIDSGLYWIRGSFASLRDEPLPDARTFLFTTRDGGRGILQIAEKDLAGNRGSIPILYRMFRVLPGVRARPTSP